MKLVSFTELNDGLMTWKFQELNKNPLDEFRKSLVYENVIHINDLCNINDIKLLDIYNLTTFQYIENYACNIECNYQTTFGLMSYNQKYPYPTTYELEVTTRNFNLFGI